MNKAVARNPKIIEVPPELKAELGRRIERRVEEHERKK